VRSLGACEFRFICPTTPKSGDNAKFSNFRCRGNAHFFKAFPTKLASPYHQAFDMIFAQIIN